MTTHPGWKIAFASALCGPVLAGTVALARDQITAEGYEWRKDDWSLTCDSTRTCRVVYGNEQRLFDDPHADVTLLFTQPAGREPLAPMESKAVGRDGEIEQFDIDGMWLDQPDHVTPGDPAALLAQASEAKMLFIRIRLPDGSSDVAEVRLQGLKAVLLKLDEVQHRAGTPLALVAKGLGKADKVLPALAAPIVKAVPFEMTPVAEAQFPPQVAERLLQQATEWVRTAKSDDDCTKMEPPTLASRGDLWVLSQTCTAGAGYNETRFWWLGYSTGADNAPSARSHATLRDVVWEAIPALGDYSEGSFELSYKGRGAGDCMGSQVWVYTQDRRWVKTSSLATGSCVGIVGGAWELPTVVTKVEWPPR